MIRDLPSARQPVMSKVELDDSTFVTTNVSVGVHSCTFVAVYLFLRAQGDFFAFVS